MVLVVVVVVLVLLHLQTARKTPGWLVDWLLND